MCATRVYLSVFLCLTNNKKKTKEGKKLKKQQQQEQEEVQEDPDCEPPAPKKKKKKDKLAVDQLNGHADGSTDRNGNSECVETPKQKKKKNTEGDTEVSAASTRGFKNSYIYLWT